MNRRTPVARRSIFLGVLAAMGALVALAGPLDPPAGPITSTFKTLTEVEPRIAISATNTPGNFQFLFRITQPGSYYLTGNITGVSSKGAIEIAANGVTLDLMGFDLVGVSGSLNGIGMNTISTSNVVIRNGSLRNWTRGVDATASSNSRLENLRVSGCTDTGILLTALNCSISDCTVQTCSRHGIATGGVTAIARCTVKSNSQVGIFSGSGCTITDCTVDQNGSTGIQTLGWCAIAGCTAVDNGFGGIAGSDGSAITNCTAERNTGNGIATGFGGSVTGCTSRENTANGISAGSGSAVTGCGAYLNGTVGIDGSFCTIAQCGSNGNVTDGIRVGSGCTVLNNTCTGNGLNGDGAGIHATAGDNRIEGNNCTTADRGIDVDFFGNIILRNTCSGNTINWTIAANNVFGPIVDRTAPASAAVSGNSAASSLGTTDANANFTY